MKRLLTLVALCLVVITALGTAGCGNRAKTALVMGTEATFQPFEYTDEKNNPIGFDVDLAKAIAAELGREIEIRNQPFDGLIGALQAKQIDLIAAGMTITPERAKTVAFSEPYYNAKQAVIVREGDSRITKLDDLKGKIVAVQMGTTGAGEGEKLLGKNNSNLKQFKKVNEAFMELKSGRADAVIIDAPVAASYMKNMSGFQAVGSITFSDEQFGIAVRKEDTKLLGDINKALKKIQDSGKYDELIQKWFAS